MTGRPITVAWLGDVVGPLGRAAAGHAARVLRSGDRPADLVIVNGENARHGRGLHPDGYRELRSAGIDAVTLGDHALDDHRIDRILADPSEPVSAPVNMARARPELRGVMELGVRRCRESGVTGEGGKGVRLMVVSVLGRLFLSERSEPDAFEAVDRAAERASAVGATLLVEVHAEATSEKQALAAHAAARWPGVAAAVVGSHTHCATADERLVGGAVAAVTDLGMTGCWTGVIGFGAAGSVRRLREIRPSQLRLAEGPARAEGVRITLDTDNRAATAIERLRIDLPETGGG